MESGTVGTTTRHTNGAGEGGRAGAARGAEPRRRGGRSPICRSTGRRRSRRRSRGCGRTQPDWEAMGIEGRYHWLGKLRDWILDNQDKVLDTMQLETGKVRADASNEPAYLADTINFYGTAGGQFHRRRKRSPPLPPRSPRRSCWSSTGRTRSSASSAPGTSR